MEAKKYRVTILDPIGSKDNDLCNCWTEEFETKEEAENFINKSRNGWYSFEIIECKD